MTYPLKTRAWIGGIAQGVKWNKDACKELNRQMEKLVEYYSVNMLIEPPKPLFSLDFYNAYNYFDSANLEKPCWERDVVHTYDCDYELLPCHMFSSLVQGKEGRTTIINDYLNVCHDLCDEECMQCPIRWSCVNCMALNYHLYRDFKRNARKDHGTAFCLLINIFGKSVAELALKSSPLSHFSV